jgi:hypothetical protein
MSKNLSPQNKITKKDLTKMIRQLAGQQQQQAIAVQQLSQIAFALAEFMDGKIAGCYKCGRYVVVDPGVVKCPVCGDDLVLGPEPPDAPQTDGPAEG